MSPRGLGPFRCIVGREDAHANDQSRTDFDLGEAVRHDRGLCAQGIPVGDRSAPSVVAAVAAQACDCPNPLWVAHLQQTGFVMQLTIQWNSLKTLKDQWASLPPRTPTRVSLCPELCGTGSGIDREAVPMLL